MRDLHALLLIVAASLVTANVPSATSSPAPGVAPMWAASTFAGGQPASGRHVDGQCSAARFFNPMCIAVDTVTGAMYVTELGGNSIRVIERWPECSVSTLAGSENYINETAGFTDGIGTAARFFMPYGIAVSSGMFVVVADSGNHAIRSIITDGTLGNTSMTIAGNGTKGYTDGTGTNAQFNSPYGIAFTSYPVPLVFVTDTYNNVIRRIVFLSKTVSTLAGGCDGQGLVFADGIGRAAGFMFPQALTLVPFNGTTILVVMDVMSNSIRRVSNIRGQPLTGVVTTIAGNPNDPAGGGWVDGVGSSATFYKLGGITSDTSGDFVFVTVQQKSSLRLLSGGVRAVSLATGAVSTLGARDNLTSPIGITTDAVTGDFLVIQSLASNVQSYFPQCGPNFYLKVPPGASRSTALCVACPPNTCKGTTDAATECLTCAGGGGEMPRLLVIGASVAGGCVVLLTAAVFLRLAMARQQQLQKVSPEDGGDRGIPLLAAEGDVSGAGEPPPPEDPAPLADGEEGAAEPHSSSGGAGVGSARREEEDTSQPLVGKFETALGSGGGGGSGPPEAYKFS